ncbi:MAG: hypothetical protein IPH49_15935 [Ignavibacteria bacterium]|nr:hypothetical protein [Ignavibacteria bacterium]
MFGLATREDVRGVSRELDQRIRETDEAIKELAREVRFPTKDLSTKLYTVEVLQGGKPFRTYRDVVKIEDNRLRANAIMFGGVSSLIFQTRSGEVTLRGEGYEYIVTEQKPEGVEDVKLPSIEKLQAKINETDERLKVIGNARYEGLTKDMLLMKDDIHKIGKSIDALNHRIEMLELRLDKTDSVKKPNRKPKSK